MSEKQQTIANIVREDYRTAEVFKKYGINFCCSGLVTLQDACALNNIDPVIISDELEKARRSISLSHSLQFDKWKVSFLVDYLINVHHEYLLQAIPAMKARLEVFIQSHINEYPELRQISNTFQKLAALLQLQIRQEEEVTFPYIRQIDAAYSRKEPYGKLFVRTLRKPLGNMEKEHLLIVEYVNELVTLTHNFTPPPNCCTNHYVLYHTLKEFHDDLVQHKHLENNVLYPRIKLIEQQLLLN